MRTPAALLTALALATLAPAPARAAPGGNTIWVLTGLAFADGGTATGYFITNFAGTIQSWNITASGGSFSLEVFASTLGSTLNAATSSSFSIESNDATTKLVFNAANTFTAVNSPDTIATTSYEQVGAGTPRYVSAGVVKAPEPLSLTLLGSGLAALGFLRRKPR